MTVSEEAKTAFTRPEVKLILQAADRMVHVDVHRAVDREFYGRLVRVLLTFGVHPSKLPKISGDQIQKRPTDRGDRYYLVFLRPKRQAKRRHIEFEIPGTMVGWLPAFLDQSKPTNPRSYRWLCEKIEDEVKKGGYSVHVNPLRFRHTSMREQHIRGVPTSDIMASYGVTYSTLERYVLGTPEQRGEKMESIGWGSWG